MIQNTGRVLGGHHCDSYALRASPVVCILDTGLMICQFCKLLAVGCNFTTAARHVWYDRFRLYQGPFENTFQMLQTTPSPHLDSTSSTATEDNSAQGIQNDELIWAFNSEVSSIELQGFDDAHEPPHNRLQESQSTTDPSTMEACSQTSSQQQQYDMFLSGSSIDRAWRQSMISFIIGALPQAIKVFGMRGIPCTQALVACYVIIFMLFELLRMTAGTAGAANLHPMSVVVETNRRIAWWQQKVMCKTLNLIITHAAVSGLLITPNFSSLDWGSCLFAYLCTLLFVCTLLGVDPVLSMYHEIKPVSLKLDAPGSRRPKYALLSTELTKYPIRKNA